MFWLLSFAGGVLVAALMTFLLGNVFGRGEELPDVKQGRASQQHWRNLTQATVTAASVPQVQFSLSLRGYRQDEVDAYLQNVRARLKQLERAAGVEGETLPEWASENSAQGQPTAQRRAAVQQKPQPAIGQQPSVQPQPSAGQQPSAPLKEEN